MDAVPGQALPSLLGRNRAHGPAVALACEREALVALFGDLGALPAIAADAFRAEIRQEAARLAFDVGAHVPGIGAGHQTRVHDLCDVGAPRVLGLRSRFDGRELVSSHVGDALGDPLDVLLDRDRHVRQHRRALRAGNREQVRVAGYSHAKIGLRAILPFLRQHPAAAALDAEFLQRAGQRVEAGSDHNDVKWVLVAAGANAVRGYFLDRAVGARIYQ